MEYESHAADPLPMRNIGKVTGDCKAVAQWMSRRDEKPSLAIIGSVGTGKTTMLRAIQYFLQSVDVGIKYVCARDLPSIADRDMEEFEEMLKPSKSYDFLLIDDVGEEPGELSKYGNKVSLFSRIIEGRYDYRIPTIITSNLSIGNKDSDGSFMHLYGPRVHERIIETFSVRLMTGDSYRETLCNK